MDIINNLFNRTNKYYNILRYYNKEDYNEDYNKKIPL